MKKQKTKLPTKKSNGIKSVVKRSAVRKCYWVCIIGETEHTKLPFGADSPIRQATQKAFRKITGHDEENCWSGWSADKKAVDRMLKAWH